MGVGAGVTLTWAVVAEGRAVAVGVIRGERNPACSLPSLLRSNPSTTLKNTITKTVTSMPNRMAFSRSIFIWGSIAFFRLSRNREGEGQLQREGG